MKRLFYLIPVLIIILQSCKDKTNFTISGKITNAEGKMIYLEELKVNSSVLLDSAKVDNDGKFEFKGRTSFPQFYLLKLAKNNFITLLMDSTEQAVVVGDYSNLSTDYAVLGSHNSELVRTLTYHLQSTTRKLDSIHSLISMQANRPDYLTKKKKWDMECAAIMRAQSDSSIFFVHRHPFSMASILALYQRFDDQNYVIQDLQTMKMVASALNSVYPKSEHVKALYDNTLLLMQKERNIKLAKTLQAIAVNSPDISLPDPSGKICRLSSLRGKYVLLQFWSALDRNSRIMNGALVDLNAKYRSRGLTIYQVSVDKNRNLWNDAIVNDRMSWINVGDMQGSNQAVANYNIQAVPANYLLDRQGKIIGKNLSAPELNQRLARILK